MRIELLIELGFELETFLSGRRAQQESSKASLRDKFGVFSHSLA